MFHLVISVEVQNLFIHDLFNDGLYNSTYVWVDTEKTGKSNYCS
jgi:hypothetical protein